MRGACVATRQREKAANVSQFSDRKTERETIIEVQLKGTMQKRLLPLHRMNKVIILLSNILEEISKGLKKCFYEDKIWFSNS